MESVLIAANWKMYKDPNDADAFFSNWCAYSFPEGREAAFFPSFPLLAQVGRLLPEGQGLGAQNCHERDEGAFTGEVSCGCLKAIGCRYVLVGHSERRHVFGESDKRAGAKVAAAIRHSVRPILCVGEMLDEREAGKTLEVIRRQLAAGLRELPAPSGFDIAYEPVWAIGTGKVAKCEDAHEVHDEIARWLKGQKLGGDARILYGGSVKPDNAAALLGTPGVQGLLVGGASLDPKAFYEILAAGV